MTLTSAVAVAALCLSYGGFAEAQSAEQPAAEKRITSTLHQMYEAEKRGDLKFIREQMADDFTEVAGDGKIYRWPEIEAGFKDVVLKEYKLSDCIFKLMTPDSAYLSCLMEVDATFKGQPFPGKFRVSYIWTRAKDRWLLRFEQGTIVPGPAATK